MERVWSLEVVTSTLISEKEKWMNKQNQQYFLGASENWSHRANHHPKNWDRWTQRIPASLGAEAAARAWSEHLKENWLVIETEHGLAS